MTEWLINGVSTSGLSAEDRGLAYGDGLFETIAVRAGQLRFANAHLARLAAGCERLRIAYPGDSALLTEAAKLVAGQSTEMATLKIIITRGTGKRGYAADSSAAPTRLLSISSASGYPQAFYTQGVRLRWCTTQASENSSLAGLKTLNRLENVLARNEWSDPDIQEGLLCDAGANAISGTMSNLFIVSHGELLTPSLKRSGIRGTMRQRVIDLWQAAGGTVKEAELSRTMVSQADEIFLTNALIGLWPVCELSGKLYTRGPVTRSLQRMLADAGVTECAISGAADA